jgi:small subunit ribosomal protein S21
LVRSTRRWKRRSSTALHALLSASIGSGANVSAGHSNDSVIPTGAGAKAAVVEGSAFPSPIPPILEPSPLPKQAHLPIFSTSHLTYGQNLVITLGVLPDESGGVSSLAEVRLQEGESLENALRRFKRKVQQEDIIKEVKRHSFYLKPGEKKRVKAALARKRARKKTRKEQD